MKTVVITSVSRGIGKALAEKFLANGDFVIGTSTTGVAPIAHGNFVVLKLDLSDAASIAACVDVIGGLGKKIDILVNNAGIWSGDEDTMEVRGDYLRKVLEVNLFGTVDLTERLVSHMIEGGHIVNISSRAGSLEYSQKGIGEHPDYNISKAALNMFSVVLAARLRGKITVSAVHPGWVKTDMGGSDADIEPEEAAEDIFKLANADVETGQFWFKGEKFPW